jgi:hypothetical protein
MIVSRPSTAAARSKERPQLTPAKHDAVLDYYGRRLATCSSDKTIKIFEVDGDQHRLTETLKGCVPFKDSIEVELILCCAAMMALFGV